MTDVLAPLPAPPRRRHRHLLVGAIGALAAVALASTAAVYLLARHDDTPATAPAASAAAEVRTSPSTGATPRGYTAAGSITLKGERIDKGPACEGGDGYVDLHGGALVMLLDAAGNVAGQAKLGAGAPDGTTCVFQFLIQGVPAGRGPYRLAVGLREGPPIDESDLARGAQLNLEVS